jgi:acyl-CoA thioester hydrolase
MESEADDMQGEDGLLTVPERAPHRFEVRVYYEDTDFSGFVYHTRYLHFMERARTEFVRSLGVDQAAWFLETGCSFVVRRMALDYRLPAKMDDALVVETHLVRVMGAGFELEQHVMRGDALLVSASVQIVCIKRGRAVRLPEDLRWEIERYLA